MKFRKKPVVIEAIQFTKQSEPQVWDFLGDDYLGSDDFGSHNPISGVGEGTTTIRIRTLEGEITASEGDWIIRGIKGEHYPCRPDIFEATYEPVSL